MTTFTGLTEQEAQKRRQQGAGNNVQSGTNRSNWDIVRTNLFSNYNNILFVIGAVLAVLGRYNDAFITVIVGFVNALISTAQEIRAKRQLEQIAVVANARVRVLRDGQTQEIAPSQLVKGDIIRLQSGDQAVVDGKVVGDGVLEMDESLLTGESDLIRKQQGDEVLSGSFCVTGSTYYEAEKVGLDSYANRLTAEAQSFQLIATPLQKNVAYTINLLILLASIMAAIFYLAGFMQELDFVANVKATAVLVGLVPYGLFLTIAVAYALGATKIARQGALVQQTNAVESLNSVDVLCMDKTGTLTTNELVLNAVVSLTDNDAIGALLGDFVRSVSSSNTTNEAIAVGTSGEKRAIADEVAFSSARKWSGLVFDEPARKGVYVLGAVEMLQAQLPQAGMDALLAQVAELSDQGLRVLLFAAGVQAVTLHESGEVVLPQLTPLALVSLGDKLRPQVAETLQAFQELGVQLKIISGDNPQTVAALAKQAGLIDVSLVSGPDLAQMSDAEVAQLAGERSVFGRISPEQKRQLVDSLIQQGHYVAMIGDGVNDVLSLKKAKLGIAMQSGSNATRNVADMVLLGDSYAALPPALREGKRIVNGITSATYLLIGRALTYALVIIGVMMVGVSFPFEPSQTGLTTFSVGLPAFALTMWARADAPREPLLSSLVRLVLPFALWTMLIGVLVYAFTYFQITDRLTELRIPPRAIAGLENFTGVDYDLENPDDFLLVAATIVAQTSLSAFLTLTAILFVLFLEPPHQFFTGWRDVSPDRRPLWLVIGLTIIFLIGLNIREVTDYFGMLRIPDRGYLAIAVALLVWLFGLRFILRRRYFDALLP